MHELAEKLLKGIDPIDKSVVIGGLPYRVVGVVAKQGTLFGISLDKFAIMPFSAQGIAIVTAALLAIVAAELIRCLAIVLGYRLGWQ